ncbi:MAG: SWIM zinc finger family protein [Chloroflexota bacterium]
MVAPKNIKQLQDASRDLTVRRTDTFTYVVESRSNPRANHTVTVSFDSAGRKVKTRCTCEWAVYQGIACKHVLAALEHMASQKERTLSFWHDEDRARRQKHKLFQLVGDEKKDRNHIWITSRNAS